MATIITKNSSTASSVPLNTQLVQGELAVNVTDKRLFTENASGTVVELGTNPSSLTLPNGVANAVCYLNGSKVLTTGSALTFDGTSFGVGTASLSALAQRTIDLNAASNSALVFKAADTTFAYLYADNTANEFRMYGGASKNLTFYANASEQMRLTSTGLGIGTSSPSAKLHVNGDSAIAGNLFMTSLGVWFDSVGSYTTGIYKSSNNMLFNTNGSTKATLDSSGNLGLGVTPSAWGSTVGKVFEGPNSGAISHYIGGGGAVPAMYLTSNGWHNGSNWIYKTGGNAALYSINDNSGSHKWYTAPSGTAGNAISFTQAMTLDANGNLGVGQTAPSGWINGNAVIAGNFGLFNPSGRFLLWGNAGIAGEIGVPTLTGFGDSLGITVTNSTGVLVLGTNTTERARIDSSGNLLVGATAFPSATVAGVGLRNPGSGAPTISAGATSANTFMLAFVNTNGTVGTITSGGSSTAYNTSSDYRLKENIQPMTGALAKVQALKPCTYKWKTDGSDGEGFIAHELAEVVPQCVTGEKDAVDAEGKPVYQGIDTSFLVATLTAAIQELKASLDEVKLEFDAYKAAHP